MANQRQNVNAYKPSQRRGSMLLEVVVGAAMLATLLVVMNQLAAKLNAHAAMLDGEVTAQQTVENLLEELTARPWDEISSDAITGLKVPAWVREKLPSIRCTGEVKLLDAPVESKHVLLRLEWKTLRTGDRRQAQLATWVFPAEGTGDE